MKLFVRMGIAVCVAVLCYFGITPTIQGSMDPPLYDRAIEAVGGFRVDEPLVLKMSFWTTVNAIGFRKANSARVDITEIGALKCGDQRHWDVTMKEDTIFTLTMDVVIPDNDTSGINFEVLWGENPYPVKFPYYFVTTGPDVEVHPGKPVDFGPMPWEVEARTIRMGDSLERIELQKPPYPSDGIIGRPYYNIAPEDSVYLDSISESSKKHFVQMRMMEDSVWAGQDRQLYMIERLCFARNPGEKKFRRIEGHTDPLAEGTRWRDSVLAVSPPAKYDIIIDLRDPDDYDYVKTLVDSLGVTEEKGFYRTVTSKAVLGKLAEHGIEFRNTFWRTRPPNQQVDDSARSKVPGRGDVIEGDERDNRNDLFLEGRAAHSLECIL